MTDQPLILTAEETRAAEQIVFDSGVSVSELMEQAGAAVADAIAAQFPKSDALVLCGPGNNGGDGYVVARLLAERGWNVNVAALAEPRSDAAKSARSRWDGAVTSLDRAEPAPLLIDALFGTGLTRPLDREVAERLAFLARESSNDIAVDLPSGVATDDGALLNEVPFFTMTVALGVHKPAHMRGPGAQRCGKVVLGYIGLQDAARQIAAQREARS